MAIRLAKEVHELHRNLHNVTIGQGELVSTNIESDDRWITVRLKPNDGYYNGGTFDFKIDIPDDYPECVPSVTCLSYIYHPNIDPTTQQCTNVCLNILDTENWCEGFGLQGLLFLLHNPNFDDLISPIVEIRDTEDEYKDDIRKSLNGEKVGFLVEVLDEVFTLMIPKMREIFAKDTSGTDDTSGECDNDTMNKFAQTSAESSDPRTDICPESETIGSEDISTMEGTHSCGEGVTQTNVSDNANDTSECESCTRNLSSVNHINSSITTTVSVKKSDSQCNSDINSVTTDIFYPVIIERNELPNHVLRSDSVDYDDLLYQHFMDIN